MRFFSTYLIICFGFSSVSVLISNHEWYEMELLARKLFSNFLFLGRKSEPAFKKASAAAATTDDMRVDDTTESDEESDSIQVETKTFRVSASKKRSREEQSQASGSESDAKKSKTHESLNYTRAHNFNS